MSPTKRLLTIATAALATTALAACSTEAAPEASPTASAEASAPAVTTLDPAPIDEAAYVERFDLAGGSLTHDEVVAEYADAAAAFPFPLPEGYGFPEEPALSNDADARSEAGSGVSIAYLFWHSATATAAYAAHERGDDAAATEHLEALQAGYASPVRSLSLDPETPGAAGPYTAAAIEPALAGDWEALYDFDVELFLAQPEYAAIADAAGDSL